MRMWSHKELFLNYLSPAAVATFICVVISIFVIVHVVARSRDIDSNDEWFSKSKGKKSPETCGLSDHHLSVPTHASGSTTSSTSPAIGVPYEAPPHDGKPLIVGQNINHHGAHGIGNVKVGVIGANAVRSHGGMIGGNINYGTNQNVGKVNLA